MYCTACGTKNDEGQVRCTSCGARLAVQPAAAPLPVGDKSFPTVIVVLIAGFAVLAIIGIVAAIAVPNFIMAKEKARQKNTMSDITQVSMALAAYVTDQGKAPVQDGSYGQGSSSTFVSALSPFYIKVLPVKDWWKNDYLVYCGQACKGQYGIADCKDDDFLVVSLGKDGIREEWRHDPANPEEGFFPTTQISDFNKDLVMLNGNWIRAPRARR